MTSALSTAEQTSLVKCERTIQAGLQAFYEVGQALKQIRDGRLYRGQYSTFEDYCIQKWQMGRAHAYRLMESSEVIQNLSPMGDIETPATERQARPLTDLPPEHQGEAWSAAQTIGNNSQPSSATVTKAAAAAKTKPAKPAPFESGAQVTVLDEESPHYGQTAEVFECEGIIVHCWIEGVDEPVPFLCNDLQEDGDRTESDPEPAPKPPTGQKANPVEMFQAELAIAAARIQLLEEMLRRGCALAAYQSPQLRLWIAEAQDLLRDS